MIIINIIVQNFIVRVKQFWDKFRSGCFNMIYNNIFGKLDSASMFSAAAVVGIKTTSNSGMVWFVKDYSSNFKSIYKFNSNIIIS